MLWHFFTTTTSKNGYFFPLGSSVWVVGKIFRKWQEQNTSLAQSPARLCGWSKQNPHTYLYLTHTHTKWDNRGWLASEHFQFVIHLRPIPHGVNFINFLSQGTNALVLTELAQKLSFNFTNRIALNFTNVPIYKLCTMLYVIQQKININLQVHMILMNWPPSPIPKSGQSWKTLNELSMSSIYEFSKQKNYFAKINDCYCHVKKVTVQKIT